MNSKQRWLAAALIAGGLFTGMRSEAADATVALDMASAYVYHGVTYNDGLVFQPLVDVSNGSFGFYTWANMDIWDYGGALKSGEFSEVDLVAYWTTSALGVSWTASYAEYLFPNVSDGTGALAGTREIILAGTRPLPLGFNAGFKVQYDIDEYDDAYARLSLGYDRALGGGVSANAAVTGGYAGEGVSMSGKSGLYDYELKLGLGYQALKNLKVNGSVSYVGALDEKVLPSQDVHVFGVIGLSYAM